MRGDWDRRIRHDYRFWMSDGYQSDDHMWKTGRRDLAVLIEGITDTKSKSYLEVGCGIGRLLRAASQSFATVTGLDVSEVAIEKAQTFLSGYPNVSLAVGNGVDLSNFKDQTFDVVGVYAALSSAPTEVFVQNIIEIQRILKPDGVFRLQFYTGKEQTVGREDTLHLRCYDLERFQKAICLAGYDIQWISPLKLDVETSYAELEIMAQIGSFKKNERTACSPDAMIEALVSKPEESGKSADGDIEYWMSLNLAEAAANEGDVGRAREALDYALAMSKSVTVDVSDVLQRIIATVERKEKELHSAKHTLSSESAATAAMAATTDYFESNLLMVEKLFPAVHATIIAAIAKGDYAGDREVTVKQTKDGAVIFVDGSCLDHPEKPTSAARNWAKQSLQELRIIEATEIAVVGFGGGYHVSELLAQTKKTISVIEPDIAVFIAALRSNDLTTILPKLHGLTVGRDLSTAKVSDEAELLIRPQTLTLSEKDLPKIKEKFYGIRGLKSLHPNIVVLGPLQGGTLPITGYTTRALQSLGQRVREIDMSPFNSGYMAISEILKEPQRAQVMHNNYIECMSQAVLESVIEKKTDILICMAQAPITARVLAECRARGIITVLWFMEDFLRFTYWREMSKFYDFVFTMQKGECIDSIKQAGAGEVHYLAAACDPVIHHPQTLTPAEKEEWGSPISFVGAGYHNRQQVFASFAEMPFKLWGTEWPGCKPFDRMLQKGGKRLNPDEYTKIFCGTDININLHSSRERDGVDPFGDFVNPRTFELASCEAFQLVDERSLLSEVFEAGKEVITFSDPADLKEKIKYYSTRPEERARIAKNSRARALKEHTYGHRLQSMLSVIYSSKYEHLKSRSDSHPWKKMLERTKDKPELHQRCQNAFARGEEPKLDGLVIDILVGNGKLTETEQKLLFLHHVSKQIIRMKMEEAGQ